MRDRSTSLAMIAVALYVVIAVLAAPALATPALGGPTTFRGWQLDGTGLFVRAASGALEPTEWIASSGGAWDEIAPASGYEDQVAGLDRLSDVEAQDALEWQSAPRVREWDERTPDEEAFRGWWDKPREVLTNSGQRD